MSKIYDVKQYHKNIPEIIKNMELSTLAPETNFRQAKMLNIWNNHRNEFYDRLFWDKNILNTWKLNRISRLVDWAYETCPYYRNKFNTVGFRKGDIRSFSDFSFLPLLSKDDVIDNFHNGLVSKKIDVKKCRWMSTSGSSGKQVQIILPQTRANLDILFKYRMFEFAGGFRLNSNEWLYNIHYCLWWHTSFLGKYPVFSVKQDCPATAILSHIKLLRPQVISSIGSFLDSLAQLGQNLRQYGVKIINTNSETTTITERNRWENIFEVPVRDEYSSEEIDILAMQCISGNYHLVEDDVYVEIINQDSTGLGEVIGTDLWNFAMPMIRYEQGDLASMKQSEGFSDNTICACGSCFRRLDKLHGRADQALENKFGETIPPGCLLDAVEFYLCTDKAEIKEFRIVQVEPSKIKLLYVPRIKQMTDRKNHFAGFNNKLNELFGHSVEFELICLDEIPPEKSFKRRTIINTIKKG